MHARSSISVNLFLDQGVELFGQGGHRPINNRRQINVRSTLVCCSTLVILPLPSTRWSFDHFAIPSDCSGRSGVLYFLQKYRGLREASK